MLPFSLQQDKRNTWILKNVIDHVERIDVHTDDMFGAKDEGKESLLKRVLGVESKPAAAPANTRTNTDTHRPTRTDAGTAPVDTAAPPSAKSSVKSVPSVPSVNREKQDSGRFNQNSDTPLLTPEEGAGDFQLFSETPKEAAKRDQAAEKAEADKLERAKAEARRNAPDLPMETTDHADNTEGRKAESQKYRVGTSVPASIGSPAPSPGNPRSPSSPSSPYEFAKSTPSTPSTKSTSSTKSDKDYSLTEDPDAKIRENAKQRIRELWDSEELKSGKDENIPLGHFSPQVIEVLHNEFGLNRINDQSQLNLKLTELHHIKLHHGELTADQAAGLVDVFYNPDWIGYSSGERKGNVLRFLQENDSGDNIGVSIYGGKNNIGYVKTFYVADSKDTLEKWKKSGIRLGPVANSDYQLKKSNRPGANPALIGPSTMPADGKINSNPAEVNPDSQKKAKNSGSGENKTYHTYQTYNTHESSDQSDQSDQPDIRYSLVKDPELLKQLDAEEKRGEYLTRYRAAQLVDGKLYPPMAAKINGKWVDPIELGKWEQADEHPELATEDGYFRLNKGNGSSVDARYNPYFHSSPTPLNDQFSSAYKRPELVTLEIRVPKSELSSGYHAELAKDAVGMHDWKAGVVQGKLSGTRQVMLSRWDKPIRIVPDSEVAQKIAEMLDGKDVTIPANVVTPSLRAELKKAGVKVEDGEKQYSLRKRQQINPIVVNGQVQAEYADLLDNKEYTPETISEWDQKAIAWIDRQGGIEPAAEMIANDTEHSDRHVATLVRRHILNSEFAESLPADIRMAVELKNVDEGKAWGREGVARRLAALTLKNIETVKALFQKLHENLSDPEKVKLRNKILEQTGVDINNLPPDLVNDKSKLDKVLRAELANTSKWHDKAYEYWINAILSAPTTHSANIIGNTANALYELGPKRFAEAAVNTLAKRKDAATFGEFREMWNALDFRSAWKKAKPHSIWKR